MTGSRPPCLSSAPRRLRQSGRSIDLFGESHAIFASSAVDSLSPPPLQASNWSILVATRLVLRMGVGSSRPSPAGGARRCLGIRWVAAWEHVATLGPACAVHCAPVPARHQGLAGQHLRFHAPRQPLGLYVVGPVSLPRAALPVALCPKSPRPGGTGQGPPPKILIPPLPPPGGGCVPRHAIDSRPWPCARVAGASLGRAGARSLRFLPVGRRPPVPGLPSSPAWRPLPAGKRLR